MKHEGGRLALLKKGGSTARVIDLCSLGESHGHLPEYMMRPMFFDRRLNTSFLVKHTLRPWERDEFGGARRTVTKVIFPMCAQDLDLGGMSVFIESRTMENALMDFLGGSPESERFQSDLERLRSLSKLPSFDPYLLYEHFRRRGDKIARCYFQVSPDVVHQMSEYVAEQIDILVKAAFGGAAVNSRAKSRRLAEIMFENQNSEELSALRQALRMTEEEYNGGIYGWKGILYYAWSVQDAYTLLLNFLKDVRHMDIIGTTTAEQAYLNKVTGRIMQLSGERWARLKSVIENYNDQFQTFVEQGDPLALKNFLLRAPGLFFEMGQDLGSLQHVASYWRFWKGGRGEGPMPASEALEIMPGFAAELAVTHSDMEGIHDPVIHKPETIDGMKGDKSKYTTGAW